MHSLPAGARSGPRTASTRLLRGRSSFRRPRAPASGGGSGVWGRSEGWARGGRPGRGSRGSSATWWPGACARPAELERSLGSWCPERVAGLSGTGAGGAGVGGADDDVSSATTPSVSPPLGIIPERSGICSESPVAGVRVPAGLSLPPSGWQGPAGRRSPSALASASSSSSIRRRAKKGH